MRYICCILSLSITILFGSQLFAQNSNLQMQFANGEALDNAANLSSVANSSNIKILYTDSLFIRNQSNQTIKLKVRKIHFDVVEGSFNIFNALSQNMTASETITSNYWELDPNATTPPEAFFRASYYPQNGVGTSSIIYSFLSVDEQDQVLDSVYVCYSFSNTSVEPLNEAGDYLYHQEVLVTSDANLNAAFPLWLHNHSNADVMMKVEKEVLQMEEGHTTYFKFGGEEYADGQNASNPDGYNIAAHETLSGDNGFIAYFQGNGVDGNESLTKVKYSFINKDLEADANYVTLVFNPSGVGFSELENIQISKVYPNPASDYFIIDHQFDSQDEAVLKVYSENGSLLSIYPINKASSRTRVSVKDLASGIYFLSIELNNQDLGVEKLMVK